MLHIVDAYLCSTCMHSSRHLFLQKKLSLNNKQKSWTWTWTKYCGNHLFKRIMGNEPKRISLRVCCRCAYTHTNTHHAHAIQCSADSIIKMNIAIISNGHNACNINSVEQWNYLSQLSLPLCVFLDFHMSSWEKENGAFISHAFKLN